MQFVQHPYHTRWLGAPPNWRHDKVKCEYLSIYDTNVGGYPAMQSSWRPEGREGLLLALNLADIRLSVISQMHPPVSMFVQQTLTDKREVLAALARAAKDLADLAQDNGVRLNVKTDAGGKVTVTVAN